MDKYIEEFCKQNPNIELDCGNSDCKGKFKIKTKDFFKSKTYIHKCNKCNKTTSYDTSKMITMAQKIFKEIEKFLK